MLLQVAYGMTETSPISFMSMPGDTTEIQSSTVGCVIDHVEVSFFVLRSIQSLLKLNYTICLLISILSFVMLKVLSSIVLGITVN